MIYNSDLTGEIISNTKEMITVSVWDELKKESISRYLTEISELDSWLNTGKPHKGGCFEESSYSHSKIQDETKKIIVTSNKENFTFKDEIELKEWNNKTKEMSKL